MFIIHIRMSILLCIPYLLQLTVDVGPCIDSAFLLRSGFQGADAGSPRQPSQSLGVCCIVCWGGGERGKKEGKKVGEKGDMVQRAVFKHTKHTFLSNGSHQNTRHRVARVSVIPFASKSPSLNCCMPKNTANKTRAHSHGSLARSGSEFKFQSPDQFGLFPLGNEVRVPAVCANVAIAPVTDTDPEPVDLMKVCRCDLGVI